MDKPSLKLGQYCAKRDWFGSIKQFLERASAHSPKLRNQTKPGGPPGVGPNDYRLHI